MKNKTLKLALASLLLMSAVSFAKEINQNTITNNDGSKGHGPIGTTTPPDDTIDPTKPDRPR